MKLNSKITEEFRTMKTQRAALEKLGILTISDMLYHFPARYGDPGQESTIGKLQEKQQAVIYGQIKSIKTARTFRGHTPMAEAIIDDGTSKIKAVWFNQPYIAKLFSEGLFVRLDGQVGKKNSAGQTTMANPKIEKVDQVPINDGGLLKKDGEQTESDLTGSVAGKTTDTQPNPDDYRLYSVYPESKGMSSNWLYYKIKDIFNSGLLDEIEDPLPAEILKKYNLPNLKTALIWIHTPKNSSDAMSARKRFAFEEIFYIQTNKLLNRVEAEKFKSYKIEKTVAELKSFTDKFPFELTDSQKKAITAVLKDMKKPVPMSRLLEGDVGSGKTAVAATAVFAAIKSTPPGRKFGNLQAAYMVPTEILAKQQFENFIQFFEGSRIEIGLMTSSGCYKFPSKVNPKEATKISKAQLMKWIEAGQIPIVVGTHSLISKNVKFKELALVIIDEQHRFGTKQRQNLAQKEGFAPHLLSMTATPIPRTLALTIYGDLDLTLIDQMPTGRKPIITNIITKDGRGAVYQKIAAEINAGRQAYVICPRIDEPDPEKQYALYTKSVKEEARILREKVFPSLVIEELHSKMKPIEKETVMKRFENGEINILVSTSVVEVGVNVPNATNIIIEGAERFGLSQLHQLRGRVLRSNHQAYCYIFTNSKNEYTLNRLSALVKAKNGFELSEYDLKLRGAGELTGNKQWGISDLGMEAIKNLKMVDAARASAKDVIETDPELRKHPAILGRIALQNKIHFE
jgi:ATP-dependent DNA helicase RecG